MRPPPALLAGLAALLLAIGMAARPAWAEAPGAAAIQGQDAAAALRLVLPAGTLALHLDDLTGELTMGGRMTADTDGDLALDGLEVTLRHGRLRLPGGWADLPEARLTATGRLTAAGTLTLSALRLRLPGLLELAGNLSLAEAGPPTGRLEGRLPDLPALLHLLAPAAAGLPLPRAGSVRLDLGSTIALDLRSEPSGPNLRLTMADDGEKAWKVTASLDGEPALPGGPLGFTGRLALPEGAPAALAGTLSLGQGRGNLSLTFPEAGPAGRLRLADVPLEFLAALASLLGRPLPAVPTGRLAADIELTPGAALPLAGTASLTGLTFSSEDGFLLGQDVALAISARPERRTRGLALSLRADHGEVLAGTFYADLSGLPLSLSARLARSADGYAAEDMAFAAGDALTIAGRAELAKDALHAALRAAVPDLGRFYARFVKDSLAGSDPAWAEAVPAGRLDLELTARAPITGTPLDISGRLTLAGGALEGAPGGLFLSGLDLDLPFAYRLRGEPAGPSLPPIDPERWGRLRLARLAAGPLTASDQTLGLALTPNRLDTAGSLAALAYGARLSLSELFVRAPLSPTFEASGAFGLEGLSFAALPTGSVPLAGQLRGRLPRWRLSAKTLTTEGALSGDFFGGPLTVWGIRADAPLSANRTVGASLAVKHLDLEPLSEALGIGRITGRLDLDLRDLEMAYGQPVAFHLMARSLPEPGVSQDVSLKAVDSITRIGTGNPLTGLGVGLIAAVFKEFPYESIGFYCDLENDVFRIRGLISSDGVEYIIKRPPFIGINVVNSNPTNRISFSDMKERVGRVVGSARPETSPRPGQEDGP